MKKLFIFIVILFIQGYFTNTFALSIGDYGSPGSYGCAHCMNSQCWIDDEAYYDNYAYFSLTKSSQKVLITNKLGTKTSTYFYLPDSTNNSVGYGVIDGFLQYYPNNPSATVYFYTDENSSIYYDYASWAAALAELGITPAPLLYP